MIKHLRHLRIRHYRAVNGLVGVDYHANWSDGWCNGECDNCKSKFICFTTGKNEFLVIESDQLDKVSIDVGYRYG